MRNGEAMFKNLIKMVKIENEKLVIEIENSTPEELLKELIKSIIGILQNIKLDETVDLRELESNQYFLLELLKNMIDYEN